MSKHSVSAIIPVKRFHTAKGRLDAILPPAHRRGLAQAMLCDVLQAAVSCPAIDRVLVVTSDRSAAGIARALGAEVLETENDDGYCAAAQAGLGAAGTARALILPSDVPSVRACDLLRLVLFSPARYHVTLVEAAVDGGTNALLVSPPGAIALRFGPSSAECHVTEAQRAGVPVRRAHCPSLAFDIDRPEDLRRFLGTSNATYTRQFLCGLSLQSRVSTGPEKMTLSAGGETL